MAAASIAALSATPAVAGFSSDLWPPDEGAWRQAPTNITAWGKPTDLVFTNPATGLPETNIYSAFGPRDALYFRDQADALTNGAPGWVDMGYEPTNVTIDVRERRAYEIFSAWFERVHLLRGNAEKTNFVSSPLSNGGTDDGTTEFAVFRDVAGNQRQALVSAKARISALCTNFVDHAYTGGDFDGVTNISRWSASSLLAYVGAPSNYLAYTPYRGLDGRPPIDRVVTQTWVIPASYGTNVASIAVTSYWGSATTISGTGNQSVVTVSTNASILAGRTTADYGWKYCDRMYGALQLIAGVVGDFAFDKSEWSAQVITNNQYNFTTALAMYYAGPIQFISFYPSASLYADGWSVVQVARVDYLAPNQWEQTLAADLTHDVTITNSSAWVATNYDGAAMSGSMVGDVYGKARDPVGKTFFSWDSGLIQGTNVHLQGASIAWSAGQFTLNLPQPYTAFAPPIVAPASPATAVNRGFSLRPQDVTVVARPAFEYVWPSRTAAATVSRTLLPGARQASAHYNLTGAPTRAIATVIKPDGDGMNISATPILSTATADSMLVLLDGIPPAVNYRLVVRVGI